jgi:predicted methyltransferase
MTKLELLDREFDRIINDPRHTTPAINAAGVAFLEEARRVGPEYHTQAISSVASRWALLRKTLARRA